MSARWVPTAFIALRPKRAIEGSGIIGFMEPELPPLIQALLDPQRYAPGVARVALAQTLVAFHATAARAADGSRLGSAEQSRAALMETLHDLMQDGTEVDVQTRLARLQQCSERQFQRLAPLMRKRLFALEAGSSSNSTLDGGIYGADAHAQTYASCAVWLKGCCAPVGR